MTRFSPARLLLILILVGCGPLRAQVCPGAGASPKSVRDAISDFQKNSREPAGADCAYRWANNYVFTGSIGRDDMDFFRVAADVQRRASEKRRAAGVLAEADDYLEKEITIRRKILDELLKDPDAKVAAATRPAVVSHLSFLVSAMALRRQYEKAATYLADRTDTSVIDDEALKVWLQAVWSCAKWDGNKTNVCAAATRIICRDKINDFLESVSSMGNRTFPPQAKRDISRLRELADGCLK
ncbi:hypothetical protein [Caenimonas aquaedulcis]|uniref:Uncharacterized protein n=1 Tax=Caenimonas aquaedulcis TaxID=2793270 RepID=A0A931H1B0_9BURK|nr:hypothetical protein [Caenimonas aquaedulcis]MBG9386654.1 hypothetical protein [Caenimonas aquaedulcis]